MLIFSMLFSGMPTVQAQAKESNNWKDSLSAEDKEVQDIIDSLVEEIEQTPTSRAKVTTDEKIEAEEAEREIQEAILAHEKILKLYSSPTTEKSVFRINAPVPALEVVWEGEGTEEAPYEISTYEELELISLFSEQGADFSNVYFVLTSNIICNSGTKWTPIGSEATPFRGIIKGNDHLIYGLNITQTASEKHNAFIAVGQDAKIYDLTFTNSTVMGEMYTSILMGYGTHVYVENCHVDGTLTVSGGASGGLLGFADDSEIVDSSSTACIQVISKVSSIGGLIGSTSASIITNANFSGSITKAVENELDYVGGIVGIFNTSTMNKAVSTGQVTGDENVGGIVGSNFDSVINDAYSLGDTKGVQSVGGIAGISLATGGNQNINSSINTGNVSGEVCVGGIVGYHLNMLENEHALKSQIQDCANQGTIWGNYRTGGVVGYGASTIILRHVYNTGDILSNDEYQTYSASYKGGIIGQIRVQYTDKMGMILSSYSTGAVVGPERMLGAVIGYAPLITVPEGVRLTYFEDVYYDNFHLNATGYGESRGLIQIEEEKLKKLNNILPSTPFVIDFDTRNKEYPILETIEYDILPLAGSGYFTYAGYDGKDHVSKFFYTDEYFHDTAYTYNPSLATSTLSLALSAFNSYEVPHDKRFKNVEALMEKMGFTAFYANDEYKIKPDIHSIGVAISNKDIEVDGKNYTLIAAAIRGANYETEWAGNFEMGLEGQHKGFNIVKEKVLDELEQYIETQEIKGDVKLWITGYSRAAATANLTAGDLTAGYELHQDINLEPENIYAYCFERPMGELESNIRFEEEHFGVDFSNIHNIVNPNDFVTKIAPDALGFKPYGKDESLPSVVYTNDYEAYKQDMLNFYEEFIYLDEYSVDFLRDRFFEFLADHTTSLLEDVRTLPPLEVILDDYIEKMAVKTLKSRDYYDESYKDAIMNLFYVTYNFEVAEGINPEKKTNEFLDLFFKNYLTSLPEITLSSMTPSQLPLAEIKGSIKLVLDKTIEDFFKDPDLIFDFLKDDMDDLLNLLGSAIIAGPIRFFQIATNLEPLAQAHVPELTLSWMRSLDPNYNTKLKTRATGRRATSKELTSILSYRKVSVVGDLSFAVYDKNDKLIAASENGMPQKITDSMTVSYYDIESGAVSVILPAEASYRIELEATADSNCSIYLDEYSYHANNVTRKLLYENLSFQDGETATLELPQFSDSEEDSLNLHGSSVLYELKIGEQLQAPSTELTSLEAYREYSEITVFTRDTEEGIIAIGSGGLKEKGKLTQVEAIPNEGYIFEGWYTNDLLISSDKQYSFKVGEDIELEARFITADISITPSNIEMRVNETQTFSLDILDSNIEVIDLTWSIENENLASIVNSDEEVCEVLALLEGETKLTATINDGAFIAKAHITVVSTDADIAVTSVTITPPITNMYVGEEKYIQADILPLNATNQNVSFDSSDTDVIDIIENGLTCTLIAKNTGQALITVVTDDGDFLDTLSITVTEKTGDGYIRIETAEDLDNIRNNPSGSYRLYNDIDLTEYVSKTFTKKKGWAPIGYGSPYFTGILDGNGHTISGLWSNKQKGSSYQGLFSVTMGAEIRNLNIRLDDRGITGGYEVGGITGDARNGTIIENCTVSGGKIIVTGGGYAGGIVGFSYGSPAVTIKDCVVEGTYIETSGNYSGGIVGVANSQTEIINCQAMDVDVHANSYGGGVAGALKGGASMEDSYATGQVTGRSSYHGGLVGVVYQGSHIKRSISKADVSAKRYAGGLVGTIYGNSSISESAAYGTVETKSYVAGGLVGKVVDAHIDNSYARGDVTGTTGVGGLVGYFSGSGGSYNKSIMNSYSAGRVSGEGTTEYGAFCGRAGVEFKGTNYYDSDTALVSQAHGTSGSPTGDLKAFPQEKASHEMMQEDTFEGWDFTDIWYIDEGNNYPIFIYEE